MLGIVALGPEAAARCLVRVRVRVRVRARVRARVRVRSRRALPLQRRGELGF